MKREEIKQKIVKIINEIMDNSYEELREEDKLVGDLQMDSINLVNVQVMLEDEFDIRFNPIEDNLTDVFETVHNLVNYIEKKIEEY